MSKTPDKPTLEDLLASKKLSNPTPECWTKFDEKVKIKTLESLHKGNSFNISRKIIPLLVFSLFPVFIFQQVYFSDNETVTMQASTSGAEQELVVAEKNTFTDLAEDLTISAVEFADNTYHASTSEEFELSYALENLRTDLLSNFAF